MPEVERKVRRHLARIDRIAKNDFEKTVLTEMTKSHRTREFLGPLGGFADRQGGVMPVVRGVYQASKGEIEGIPPDPSLEKRMRWALERTNKQTGG